MLSEEEKKHLIDSLEQAENEVNALKSVLENLNKEKELWFSKKSEIGTKIKERINTVKNLKQKRNEFTNEVRNMKKVRDRLNTEISLNIKEIVKKKKDIAPAGHRFNPGKLNAEIKKIEFKLETEPMKYSQEQKMMKRLKDLKKELAEASGFIENKSELKEKSTITDKLKEEANKIHKDMKDKAQRSQEFHEQLIKLSDEIDELKKEEEDAYKKFFELKQKHSEKSNELKDKQRDLNEIKARLGQKKKEVREVQKKADTKALKEKAKEVEEKITNRKKLTTEDLLILQRSGEDEDKKESDSNRKDN